ncbi:MAG: type II/IV secretion system protein [Gammaproteobacteria bacterium]|nr:type II/IV secretion system protein [Gammaproteobacteria bacterium]
MLRTKKTYIAEMLLEHQLITQEQLQKAIDLQKKTDKKIGQILIELGYIAEPKLLELLSKQLHVPYIDLKTYPIEHDLVKKLPEFNARHSRAIVLRDEGGEYLVGMVDPQDLLAHEEIERLLQRKIKVALIREEDLLYVLDNIYRRADEISHFAETLSAELKPTDAFSEKEDFSSEDMPVVNLVRSIFEDAVQINASDIHIEPGENVLRIRLRVDGVLQEQIIEEKTISQALVQRIKLVAGLNIAEKRLPQDGRFSINVKNKTLDVRVSTIPVQYGESLVMRLLNQSSNVLHIDQIGMPEDVYKYFSQVLFASYGLLLIVGPTGSGKTTTLYGALNELNKAEKKIITVEDPVEYRLPRINQVQVNPKINLTFASILRSILRQDPDIIMIGELRDQETVEIALRAAMTGHFVLATLHTNDTISTATRLLDMGAEGYLVASVLRAVLAQRLVRKICKHCITDAQLTPQERSWLAANHEKQFEHTVFKKGMGCTHCHQTGYQGRVGVFELLPMTEELTDAIRQSDTGTFQRLAVKQPLYHSLTSTALDLAVKGITTVEEVISMAGAI